MKTIFFYIGFHKQAADFETTNEYIVNHIKKTYSYRNDISESFKTLKKINADLWNPRL